MQTRVFQKLPKLNISFALQKSQFGFLLCLINHYWLYFVNTRQIKVVEKSKNNFEVTSKTEILGKRVATKPNKTPGGHSKFLA